MAHPVELIHCNGGCNGHTKLSLHNLYLLASLPSQTGNSRCSVVGSALCKHSAPHLTVDSVTDGANGSVTINDDGTVTYTPDDGFWGTDYFL